MGEATLEAIGLLLVGLLASFLGRAPTNIKVDDRDPAAAPTDGRVVARRRERIGVLPSRAAVLTLVGFALATGECVR